MGINPRKDAGSGVSPSPKAITMPPFPIFKANFPMKMANIAMKM